MYASKTTRGFYDTAIHGTKMPADVTPESEWQYTHAELLEGQSQGKMIDFDEAGRPFLADPPPPAPLTTTEIEQLRLRAYADPITGSDRYFAEAARLQAMGGTDDEIEAARAAGSARYAEIQAAYPWP